MLKKMMKRCRKRYRWSKNGDKTDFSVKEAEILYFQDRLCVLDDKELKKKLLFEAHNKAFTMHP